MTCTIRTTVSTASREPVQSDAEPGCDAPTVKEREHVEQSSIELN